MPVVSSGAAAPTAAAPAATPAAPTALHFQSGLPTGPAFYAPGGMGEQLRNAAAANHGGILDWAGAPLQKILHYASQPVYSVGSLLSGHPGEALQHLAQLLPVTHLAEALPGGIGHEVKKFTTPNSDVLPSQSALLAPLLAHLPNGLRQGVGFVTDIAADPLSWVSFGAGGAAEAGARTAARLAEEAAAARIARATEGLDTAGILGRGEMTSRLAELQGAQRAAALAQDATRAARAPGAHLKVGIAGTKYTKELGAIPGTGVISRGATRVGQAASASDRFGPTTKKLEEYLLAGGRERRSVDYRASQANRRTTNSIKQGMVNQINHFDQRFAADVRKLGKTGARGPDGKPWNVNTAYEQLAHHLEQPGKYVIPDALKPHATWAREFLDRLKTLEGQAGIEYEAVPEYLTHRMRTPRDSERYSSFAAGHGHAVSTPFFVKSDRFKNIEAIQSAVAKQADVDAGRAKAVGEHLRLDPETHVAKLLKARAEAHVNAMQSRAERMNMAQETGVRRPMPADVNVPGAEARVAEATALRQGLTGRVDISGEQAAVQSARARRRFAQEGVRVARKTPYHAALSRAARRKAIAEGRVAAAAEKRARSRALVRSGRASVRNAAGVPNLPAQMRAARELEQTQGAAGLIEATQIPPLRAAAAEATATAQAGRAAAGATLPKPSRYTKVRLESGKEVRLAARQKRARRAQPAETPKLARSVPSTARGRALVRKYFDEVGPLTAAEKAAHKEAATAEREVLRATRGGVERARKKVVAAMRSRDPVLIRQAREALAKSQRDHMAARIEHAAAVEAKRGAQAATQEGRRIAGLTGPRSSDPLLVRQAEQMAGAAGREVTAAERALAARRGRTVGTQAKIRSATRRELRAQQVLRRRKLEQVKVEDIRKRLAAQPGREATPEEWQRLKTSYHSIGMKGVEDVRIPTAQKDVLLRLKHDIDRSLANPKDAHPIMGFARKLTSHWKSLALISPGYHLRNAYGDAVSAWWAGARNPVSYMQAARIVKHMDNPEKLRAMKIRIGGKTYTGDEFLNEATAMGIHGQGQIGSEFAGARDEHLRDAQSALRRRLGPLGRLRAPGRGKVSEKSQQIGQMREDATRIGTYLDLRKQGKSIVDAAETTHMYHYDYQHVSDFIDDARKFWMPFITYTAKSVPRTAKQIATRPGYFSHHASLAQALSSAAGMQGGPEGLPIGQRSSFGVPDPGGLLHKILGMPQDQPILWNPERTTPYGVVNSLDPLNWQQTAASNLPSPFLKTPIEAATGHRFYYAGNAPRRAVAPPFIQALERLGIPIPDEGAKMSQALGREVPGYSAVTDQFLRMLPLFSQAASINPEDPQRMRTSLASLLGGLPLQSYDRAALMERAQKYGG